MNRSHVRVRVHVLVAALALAFATRPARAQLAPAPHAAPPPAPQAAPPAPDGGVGESAYGCVESVPRGAQKPIVFDSFPARGTSGWAATLSITVRHGKGEKVLPSGLDLSHAIEAKKVLKEAGFAIPEQDGGASAQIWTEKDDPQKPGATTHLEMPLVLLPPKPGRSALVLPPLPVAVARANGEIMTMCTQPHGIVVEDPIANVPDARPVDNPPPIPQREEWTALKNVLFWSSIGLVVGAVAAWLLYRRLTAPKPPPPPPPPRPPWEVALEKLDEVRHAGLLEVKRHTEYFDRVSDAVRGYLGARFGFDGLESTTDEILASLKTHGAGFVRFDAPRPDGRAEGDTGEGGEGDRAGKDAVRPVPAPGVPIEDIARFLRECDLVKFANLTPTPEQCASAIEAGEKIVRATMPIAQAAPRPTPPSPPPPGGPS